jgi:hypothetical protein
MQIKVHNLCKGEFPHTIYKNIAQRYAILDKHLHQDKTNRTVNNFIAVQAQKHTCTSRMTKFLKQKHFLFTGEASLDPLLFKSIQTGEPTQEWVQLLPALSDK